MRRRNTLVLTLVSLAVLSLANAAHAQYASQIVKVNIPFDFSVNDKTFPGGEYALACSPLEIVLRDSQSHVVAVLLTHSVESLEPAPATKLEFFTDGGDRALMRLWVKGDRKGYELRRSKAAVAFAKQHSHPQVIAGGGANLP